eukprot:2142919-Ditylum_brightwellii.AAC.1
MESTRTAKGLKDSRSREEFNTGVLGTILCMSIHSSFSLRNMLPIDIEWQVADAPPGGLQAMENPSLLDGSSLRRRQQQRYGSIPLSQVNDSELNTLDPGILKSGLSAEVFSCNFSFMMVHARFRCNAGTGPWTEWAPITLSTPGRYGPQEVLDTPDKILGKRSKWCAVDHRDKNNTQASIRIQNKRKR